jgi:teichuronic acid biosynthesis glycosyltransferase TuaC
MKILVLAPDYPKPGRPLGGSFNQRSVAALRELCDGVEVLSPRPYAPPLISSLVPRWKIHSMTRAYEIVNGVPVFRPARLQIPRIGGAFCLDRGAFFFCRSLARNMHRRNQFDAILSFDLLITGGLAWRIGRDLGIAASGWATGGDVRVPPCSSFGRAVVRALRRLDTVFYQSHELREKAADLLGLSQHQIVRDKHVVLPRGVPEPPVLPRNDTRTRVRKAWGVRDDHILVLNVGRISREKGTFELLEGMLQAVARNSKITGIIVGSVPAFDETEAVEKKLAETPGGRQKVKILPACRPDEVWEYYCAADIFVFTSYHEGMPNSLLEAMVSEVPAVAFAIPAVLEIEAATGAVVLVPPFDTTRLSEAIVRLAASPDERARIGKIGKRRVLDGFMARKSMAIAVARLAGIRDQKSSRINGVSPNQRNLQQPASPQESES